MQCSVLHVMSVLGITIHAFYTYCISMYQYINGIYYAYIKMFRCTARCGHSLISLSHLSVSYISLPYLLSLCVIYFSPIVCVMFLPHISLSLSLISLCHIFLSPISHSRVHNGTFFNVSSSCLSPIYIYIYLSLYIYLYI